MAFIKRFTVPTNYPPRYQELHLEFVENDREQKHELSVHQKQQELEDRVMQHLADKHLSNVVNKTTQKLYIFRKIRRFIS